MASFLKKIGKGIAKAGKVVGNIAQKAAPFAGLIPGVGPLAGLALGAGGSVLAGHNLATTLKSGAAGAASGFAGSKLLGGQGIGGLAKGVLGGGGASAATGAAADAAGGIPGSIGSLVKTAAAHGISIGDLIKGGLTAGAGISGLVSAHKAGKAGDAASGKQLAIADAMNARGGAMADAASKGLLARLAAGPRATPNFSQFIDRANPFAGNFAPPPPVAPAPAPNVAPVLPPPNRLALPPVKRPLMLPAPVARYA